MSSQPDAESSRTSRMFVEDYEDEICAKLRTHFELNQTASDLDQPNDWIPFRRSPKPDVIPDMDTSENGVIRQKMMLVWFWLTVLVQIDYAFLYNGTPESANLFEQATGLTPAKFAQGFLEVYGNVWRYFHLKSASSGKELVRTMLELWSESVKRWRCIGKAAARNKLRQRFGAEHDRQTSFAVKELKNILITTPERRHEAGLLKAFEPKGYFDCNAHPTSPFCSCSVAMNVCVW